MKFQSALLAILPVVAIGARAVPYPAAAAGLSQRALLDGVLGDMNNVADDVLHIVTDLTNELAPELDLLRSTSSDDVHAVTSLNAVQTTLQTATDKLAPLGTTNNATLASDVGDLLKTVLDDVDTVLAPFLRSNNAQVVAAADKLVAGLGNLLLAVGTVVQGLLGVLGPVLCSVLGLVGGLVKLLLEAASAGIC